MMWHLHAVHMNSDLKLFAVDKISYSDLLTVHALTLPKT